MNQLKNLFLKASLILILIPFYMVGQNNKGKTSDRETLILAAHEIMVAAATCALITVDDANIPMVRIMDPFPAEPDFTVWFGTNSKSRKVRQIRANPNVTLYYQDSDASGYVVIHGKAQIIDEPAEKQNRWKETWKDFYPGDRSGYVLIKVSPEWMEILSVTRGISGHPETWETPVVRFD